MSCLGLKGLTKKSEAFSTQVVCLEIKLNLDMFLVTLLFSCHCHQQWLQHYQGNRQIVQDLDKKHTMLKPVRSYLFTGDVGQQ